MTKLEVATLACKIIGLWLLARFLSDLSAVIMILFIPAVESPHTRSSGWTDLMQFGAFGCVAIAQLAVALFFWFRAPHIARRMISGEAPAIQPSSLSQNDWMAVAFSAVGVFILIPAIQSLFHELFLAFDGYERFSRLWAEPDWQANFWSAIIGVAVSLWLIFGARGIVKIVAWAREKASTGGLRPPRS